MKEPWKVLLVFAQARFSLPIGLLIMQQLNNMAPAVARSIRSLSAALAIGSGILEGRPALKSPITL